MEVKAEQADRAAQADRGTDSFACSYADLVAALWRGKVVSD